MLRGWIVSYFEGNLEHRVLNRKWSGFERAQLIAVYVHIIYMYIYGVKTSQHPRTNRGTTLMITAGGTSDAQPWQKKTDFRTVLEMKLVTSSNSIRRNAHTHLGAVLTKCHNAYCLQHVKCFYSGQGAKPVREFANVSPTHKPVHFNSRCIPPVQPVENPDPC